MDPYLKTPLFLGFLLFLITPSPAATTPTCSSQKFSKNRVFDSCNDLPQLSSYLHWTYVPSNGSLDLAFVAPPVTPDGWVSWGINPAGPKMIGTQSLIGFRGSDGAMTVKTYNVSSYGPLVPGEIGMEVSEVEGEFSGGLMTIFARVLLLENITTVNQVWQVGGSVNGSSPGKHEFGAANMNSVGSIDLVKGDTSSGGGSKNVARNIHGVLNAVSWGVLMPIGAMIARYMKTFKSADPAWFYLHKGCQVSAYIMGVAGWGLGIKLGRDSEGVSYPLHGNIGITLFCLGTLQVLALFLRPMKDHKYRKYWNFYHRSVGYITIMLSIWNVFLGLMILHPEEMWREMYIAIIIGLAVISVLLEAFTWTVVLKRKSKTDKPHVGSYETMQ